MSQTPTQLYLLDTNILVRLTEIASPLHATTLQAVRNLFASGAVLCITGQNLIEFWNVATRPAKNNGLGLTVAQATSEITKHKTAFRLLPDTPDVLAQWEVLVLRYAVEGKQAHDTRLVAVALVYNIGHILTFNARHFRRFTPEGLTVIEPDLLPVNHLIFE